MPRGSLCTASTTSWVTSGRTVTFDLLGAGPQTLSLIEPLLPHIDYFMPSIEEARDISGAADVPSAAGFFLGRGVKHCVFTLGGDGACFVAASGETVHQPAYAIDVVDTTGCGDAFDAGFITALHHRMDVSTALAFAQASAALVATGLGSDAGIRSTVRFPAPHRADVLVFPEDADRARSLAGTVC